MRLKAPVLHMKRLLCKIFPFARVKWTSWLIGFLSPWKQVDFLDNEGDYASDKNDSGAKMKHFTRLMKQWERRHKRLPQTFHLDTALLNDCWFYHRCGLQNTRGTISNQFWIDKLKELTPIKGSRRSLRVIVASVLFKYHSFSKRWQAFSGWLQLTK